MRLRIVTGTEFITECFNCYKTLLAGEGKKVYADLDGPAFKAYYCAPCARETGKIEGERIGSFEIAKGLNTGS